MTRPDPDALAREATLRRFFQCLTEKRIDDLAEVYTEDAVQENPYAPPGFPPRFEGRQGLIDHYRGAVRSRRGLAFDILQVHHTLDPEVIIAQVNARSEVPETGRTYAQHYVFVVHFRGHQIARTQEYFNPLVLLGAFGGSVESVNAIMGH